MLQVQGCARYVEAFKCLASEFYVLYFSRIDTFWRDFLPPSLGHISKPRVGSTNYGTGSTWVWECLASHCMGSDYMGDTGVKVLIILKVDIMAAGCEVVKRTKLFYKVLRMVLCNLINSVEFFLYLINLI